MDSKPMYAVGIMGFGAGPVKKRDELLPGLVPHGDRIHRTSVARAQQPLALHLLGVKEGDDPTVVQLEGFGGFLRAVLERDAQVAVDAHP